MFRDWISPSVSLGGETCKRSLEGGAWIMFCERIVLVVLEKRLLTEDRAGHSHLPSHVIPPPLAVHYLFVLP